MLLFHLVL
jgi:toxin ParE1/3/4